MADLAQQLLALLRERECTFSEIQAALGLTVGVTQGLLIRVTFMGVGLYEDVRTRPGGSQGVVVYGVDE